jgi:hypothetical protein
VLFAATTAALAELPAAVATARPAAITGKLSERGYTVIAVSPAGRARSARTVGGRFNVRPPAQDVTLHLRDVHGKYAGPVVVARDGGRAVLGVRAGARLGSIMVHDGYARVARRLPRRWIDSRLRARARNGVPIGARVFGRVRSRPGRHARGHDRDRDGIPDILDIDDDGDLVLDAFDRSPRARSSQQENAFSLSSVMNVSIDQTANANAPGFTPQLSAETLRARGTLKISVLPGDSTELDCGRPQKRSDPTVGGLVYCSAGGTGGWAYVHEPPNPPFPACCDADGDGFGTLKAAGGFAGDFFLAHGTDTDHIGTGDLLIERVTDNGVETQYPATLGFVFATTPALASYTREPAQTTPITYPVARDGLGTGGNGLPVSDGPDADQDIEVALTLWPPQRRPIAGEACLSGPTPCEWVDIGHLTYETGIDCVEGIPDPAGCALKGCPQGALSTTDPKLTPSAPIGQPDELPLKEAGGFTDTTNDRPAERADVISFTVNLTKCVAAYRSLGISFDRFPELSFFLAASGVSGDFVQQNVAFRRQ